MGLYDAVLIKDNHIAAAGSVTAAVAAVRASVAPHLRVQVEVESEAQAEEALAAGAEWLLLDNRSRRRAARAREALPRSRAARSLGRRHARERAGRRGERRTPRLDRRAHAFRAVRGRRARRAGTRCDAGRRAHPRCAARCGRRAALGRNPVRPARRLARPDLEARRGAARGGLPHRGRTGRRLSARRNARPALRRRDPAAPRDALARAPLRVARHAPTRPTASPRISRATAPSTAPRSSPRARARAAAGSGRSFFSPPYANLYTSIVLRPHLDTARAPTTILAAAVAVAETVAASVRRPGRGRDQVAERRAARRAQDLRHPDGDGRRGDPRAPSGARHRRQPECGPRALPGRISRARDQPRIASRRARSIGWTSRRASTITSKRCSTGMRREDSRR